MFSTLVAAASFALASLAAEPDDDAKGRKRAEATRDGVRELLETAWNAPSGKVKSLGAAALNRYRKRDADPVDLQFAYGLALARHGEWEAAESNFRKVAEKLPANSDAALALCHAHAAIGRYAQAIEDLRRLWQADGLNSESVETIAVLSTFLSAKPPAKFRAEDARRLEADVFPTLSEELQAAYREARERVQKYLDELPALREELMTPLETLRTDVQKAQREAEEAKSHWMQKAAEANRRKAQLDRIAASSAADAARYDRLIQAALARGDGVRAQAYQAEKIAVLEESDAQARVELARLNEAQLEVRRALENFQACGEKAQRLARELVQSESAIEAQLRSPPPTWRPAEARARLLAAGAVGPKPEKPAKREPPNRPRTDEDRARTLLQIADSLRASGSPELAAKYYQRARDEYPQTAAGKDAAWELERTAEPHAP